MSMGEGIGSAALGGSWAWSLFAFAMSSFEDEEVPCASLSWSRRDRLIASSRSASGSSGSGFSVALVFRFRGRFVPRFVAGCSGNSSSFSSFPGVPRFLAWMRLLARWLWGVPPLFFAFSFGAITHLVCGSKN